jgi:hypothetical protein
MIRKTTFLKWQACIWLLLFQAFAFAQAPTFTSYAPLKVTQRSSVVINGANFNGVTAVKFNTVSATSFTVNTNGTAITAIVPEVTGSSTVTVSVTKGNPAVTTTAPSSITLTYVAPASTPAGAKITRVITNWNGYWSSKATSNVASNQPDTEHSVVAFEYRGVLYSTGSESEVTSPLATGNVTGYTTGNFRALPIDNILGSTPATATGNPNLIILGSKVDGSTSGRVHTAPSVAGLTVRNVLIDGIRGLNIGSGVTNLPSSSVLTFQASNIIGEGINDATPDIIVSQVGAPDQTSDIYSFIDANGDIVGTPIQVNFTNIDAIGTYKSDLFTLPANTALNTATVNGSTVVGGNTRDMRIVAYKLSDFGIDTTNKDQAVQFKVMPGGTSDPAFLAYNRNTFLVPAPEITGQPVSQAVCPGNPAQFTVTVEADGTETTYQWEKDGVALTNGGNISGATSSTLVINPVTASDAGMYRCVVTNPSGAAFSNSAYLNSVILSVTGAATCVGTPTTLEVGAQGVNLQYQWYYNAQNNSNTGGQAIGGATSTTYQPPVSTNGTNYYYVTVTNGGYPCTATTSNPIAIVVSQPVAGVVTGTKTICQGTSTSVSVTDYAGLLQWEQSTDNGVTWTAVNGDGTTATYNTGAVITTTQYRVVASSGTCTDTSGAVTVTIDADITWLGTSSTAWNNAANWACNAVPTEITNVTIPANTLFQPAVLTGHAYARTVTVLAGASLTIATGATLDVVNEVNVASTATFTVQHNGALVQQSDVVNTGKITVNKNSNSLYRLDYTMWTSPVAGQQLLAFSPSTLANRFYEYKYAFDTATSTDREAYFPVNPTTNFLPAKAYLIRMPNSSAVPGYNDGTTKMTHNGVFTGTPHNGTITTPLSIQGNHFTAIGNPYPSPINVKEFFDSNANVITNSSALYLWRKTNNNANTTYAALTLAGYITNPAEGGGAEQATFYTGSNTTWVLSQGQGFIVRSITGAINPVATFTNSMRRPAPTSGTIGFFKNGEATASRLWLNLVGQNGSSQTAIAYIDGATTGIDYGYDGMPLNDNSATTLYSVAAETKLGIQARPAFDSKDVVTMGYDTKTAGSYTLSLDHTDGVFEQDQEIFIKDNLLGLTHDIKKGAYTFTTEAGTFTNRIEVVYAAKDALGTDNPALTANNVIIFKQGNDISVNTGTAAMSNVTVYDVRGRILLSKNNINATQTTISGLTVQQQVLIVEVTTNKGKVSKKLVF